VEKGTHEGLLKRNGHYAKLWRMQLRSEDDLTELERLHSVDMADEEDEVNI
jgi:hypothetical protein